MEEVRFQPWHSIRVAEWSEWLFFPTVADALQHMRRSGSNVMQKYDAFLHFPNEPTYFRFGTAPIGGPKYSEASSPSKQSAVSMHTHAFLFPDRFDPLCDCRASKGKKISSTSPTRH